MRATLPTLLGMLLLTNALQAAPDPSTSAVVPLSRQLDFKSGINDRTYRIQVAMPFAPAATVGPSLSFALKP